MATGVTVSETDGVLRIVLDVPETLNAVTVEMLDALADTLEGAATRPSVRAVLLSGAGERAFCAGGSLDTIHDTPRAVGVAAANRAVRAMVAVPVPVVCAVNGVAAGVGVSLALAADLVVAHERAKFQLAFTPVGLMPDGGASALVAASLGRHRAMRMALLAEPLSCAEAAEAGLVTKVSGEEFTEHVEALVKRLAQGPATAYAHTKAAVNAATLAELPAAMDRETAGQMALMGTDDFREGVAAFLERRPARFGRGLAGGGEA